MDPTSQLRLSLGFISIVINIIFGKDKGRKSTLSSGAIEVLYSAYFSKICMGDIAGMLKITPSSATDLVNYLEREGYVKRVQDEKNRRSFQVIPTEKGEEWILDTEEKMYGFLESHLGRLAPHEQLMFADFCARFTGVSDGISFISGLKAFNVDTNLPRVPLIAREKGKLLRLEEVVDARYADNQIIGAQMNEKKLFNERTPETDDGIQDEFTVEEYNQMQKGLRDQGHLPVEELIEFTKDGDNALEIGPGPGYLGLEWLRHTKETQLIGLEISPAMIHVAEKNAQEYQISGRVSYKEGNALDMPFQNDIFDLAFSNGSLHEWEDARQVFAEIFRVLKIGGRVSVSDLRRDLSPEIFQFMKDCCEETQIQEGFVTSVMASYVKEELEEILDGIGFSMLQVITHPYGLVVIGEK